MSLVVDASIALAWTLPDERDEIAERVLERLMSEGALAPMLWHWEVQNGLHSAQRRGRIEPAQVTEAIRQLRALPVELREPAQFGRDLTVAREHGLSVCDATYLELTVRTESVLATVDKVLATAASRVGLLAEECT